MDLKIDSLRLDFGSGLDQAYRAGPVASRAMELLADRLEASWADRSRTAVAAAFENLKVAGLPIDWGRMSDEDAAKAMADGLFESLAVKLKVGVSARS